MIKVKVTGNFHKFETFANRQIKDKQYIIDIINKYGRLGVQALSVATPKDTGKTAASWSYELVKIDQGYKLVFSNSNTSDGIPIVILLEYGHATKNGAFIPGRNFIEPTIRSIFDDLARDIWGEVTR